MDRLTLQLDSHFAEKRPDFFLTVEGKVNHLLNVDMPDGEPAIDLLVKQRLAGREREVVEVRLAGIENIYALLQYCEMVIQKYDTGEL